MKNNISNITGASGLQELEKVIANPLKPLSKEYGFSLHTHKDNCMGVRFYYHYLRNGGKVHGGQIT